MTSKIVVNNIEADSGINTVTFNSKLSSSEFIGNVTGNLTGTASTATAAATAYGISGSPTLSGITSVSTTNLTVNGNAYPSDGAISGARNRIINGDMKIFQRGTATTIGASSVYALDRWLFGREAGTESARFTVTKESLTSSDTPFASDGTTNTMKIDITTASGGISASQSHYLTQRIEGFNVSDLAYGTSSAKSCVASFWIKADNKTGTMGVSLYNGGNRSYIQNISVTSSWTKYSLVFPGDTSGAIADDNTQQLTLSFALSAGSNLQNTANTWVGGFDVATSSQADFTDSTSNNIYITGVQLEVGTVATPFERRSYGQELALCQRYYYRVLSTPVNVGNYARLSVSGLSASSTTAFVQVMFPVTMRTAPSSVETTGTPSNYQVATSTFSAVNATSITFNIASAHNGEVSVATAGSLSSGNSTYLIANNNTTAYLGWSAEL
jgi:hypothetical protein